MTERSFEPAPIQYSFTQAEEDAFPVSKHEVDGWCARLRNLSDPVISPEAWAAATVSLFAASIFALIALPDRKHHASLVGFYWACIIFFGLLTAFLIWLAHRLRANMKSQGEMIAREMETIRDKRLTSHRSSQT